PFWSSIALAMGSVEQLEQAFSLFSLDPTLRDNLATAHALLGRKLLESKSYEEAAKHFGRLE
ncbi:hypothetical protein, partial [Serratia marcescens]|uniref:hypothetical protein n=1 Tax=Serratia marcescens TaxID=615 RepID=UPI0019532AEE